MAKDEAARVFESTRAALKECHDRMDFPPRTRREAEARIAVIEACVAYAERFSCILSDKMPGT
jgi:hypothetical protein